MGIEVLDERPYEIELADGSATWIYDFGLRLPAGRRASTTTRAANMVDALPLLWRDEIEQDGFNALVVRAGTDLVAGELILRAYAKYLRQAGTTFSQGYIEQALVDNPQHRRRARRAVRGPLRPGRGTRRTPTDEQIDARIEEQLADRWTSLDQDRILRSFSGLVIATLRTNAYRTDRRAAPAASALAMKLDPRLIPDLPAPRPRHRDLGLLAAGGRRAPALRRGRPRRAALVGSPRGLPHRGARPGQGADGEERGHRAGRREGRLRRQACCPTRRSTVRRGWPKGVACYRTFISCLLDVTDNYVTGADGAQSIVAPAQVRRYDGDDPYLVVAADKGTATFSDIANGISADYGFWLGDAFASGGSVGYDHKAMGITARGAWESVKLPLPRDRRRHPDAGLHRRRYR